MQKKDPWRDLLLIWDPRDHGRRREIPTSCIDTNPDTILFFFIAFYPSTFWLDFSFCFSLDKEKVIKYFFPLISKISLRFSSNSFLWEFSEHIPEIPNSLDDHLGTDNLFLFCKGEMSDATLQLKHQDLFMEVDTLVNEIDLWLVVQFHSPEIVKTCKTDLTQESQHS